MNARTLVVASLTVLATAGCGEGIAGPNGSSSLAVRMRAATPSGAADAPSPAPAALRGVSVSVSDGSLVMEGSNGTLVLDDVRLIVAEFELEAEDRLCEREDDDGCPDFEARPFFLDLPLDGDPVTLVTGVVPEGIYHRLEFEAEDVDLDEEDEDDAEIVALRQEVRTAFPDWPEEASLVVSGSFARDGGEPEPFTAFFEAEVEVEMDLDPALEITGDGASRTLTVDVRPDRWFGNVDGSVMDLTAFDFESTGRILEFEAKFENGFTEIELD